MISVIAVLALAPGALYRALAPTTFKADDIIATTTMTTPTYIVSGGTNPTLAVCNASPPTSVGPAGSVCVDTVASRFYQTSGGGTWAQLSPGGGISGTLNQTARFTGPTSIGNAWPIDNGTTWGVAGKFSITESSGQTAVAEIDGTGSCLSVAAVGTINNWDPTAGAPGNLNGVTIVREAPSGALTLTGMIAGNDGQFIILRNTSTTAANAIQLVNESASSTVGNRFTLPNGANGTIPAGASCTLRYSLSATRWEPASGACLISALTAIPNATLTVTDTGTVNDYNPPGLSSASLIVFNNATTLSINGLSGGQDGRVVNACAVGAGSVAFNNENGSSLAANRFNFTAAANQSLTAGGTSKMSCIQLQYITGTINRWTALSQPQSTSVVPAMVFSGTMSANGGLNANGTVNITGISHLRFQTSTPPTLSVCGTGPTVVGTDSSMTITTGTGATACTVTFAGSSWGSNHPACTITPEGGAAFPSISYSTVTAFTLGAGTAASTSYDVHCFGVN